MVSLAGCPSTFYALLCDRTPYRTIWPHDESILRRLRKSAIIAFVPASLALVSFVISIGPWGVFSYPFQRQEARLIKNLKTANILVDGKIIPLKSERDISKELSTEITSGINYLCDFDNCTRVKELFPEQAEKVEKQLKENWEKWNTENTWAIYPWAYSWEIQSEITRELKVNLYPYDDAKREFPEQEYLYYNTMSQWGQFPLEIGWYDSLVQVLNDYDAKYMNGDTTKYPYVTIDAKTNEVYYHTASGVFLKFSLKIPEKLLDSSTLSSVEPNDLIFTTWNDALEIRLMLQSLTLKNPKFNPQAFKADYMSSYIGWSTGLALIKKKK